MAISPVPFALQNAAHPAALFRQAVASLVPGGGVVVTGDFAVTQTGTPSMAVTIGVGRVWIPGSEVANVSGGNFSTQALYYAQNEAAVTLTIATSNPTNPRIDVAYVSVNDQAYSGTLNQANIGIVTGTPNATPVAPAIPNNALAIGQIAVAANASSIVNANITLPAHSLTKHAEWTITGVSQASGVVHNVGTFTPVVASTTDPNYFTILSGSGIQPAQPGVYMVTFTQAWSAVVGTSRAFLQINSQTLGAGTQYSRNGFGNAEDTASTTATIWVPPGGALYLSVYQATGGPLTNSGYVTIQKVG